MTHNQEFFAQVAKVAETINLDAVENIVQGLVELRTRGGRLFLLVGGSAANCSHEVNDFRKLCDIEAYTTVDNVSELMHGQMMKAGEPYSPLG